MDKLESQPTLKSILTDDQQKHFTKISNAQDEERANLNKLARVQNKTSGRAKKQGRGGKYTWNGSFFDPFESMHALDEKDPNYDPTDEQPSSPIVVQGTDYTYVKLFKQEVTTSLKELFVSGSISEALTALGDAVDTFDAQSHAWVVPKSAVRLAMDHGARECELVSQLLPALLDTVAPQPAVEQGLTSLISQLPDLLLDVPGAVQLLANFLARAIHDQVVPSQFVREASEVDQSCVLECATRCEELLRRSKAGEVKLGSIWGADSTFESLQSSYRAILTNYFTQNSLQKAETALASSGKPFARHEFIKEGISRVMDHPDRAPMLTILFAHLAATGNVSQAQLQRGFWRVWDRLVDLKLDVPQAGEVYSGLVKMCQEKGVLGEEFSPAGWGDVHGGMRMSRTEGGVGRVARQSQMVGGGVAKFDLLLQF